ncbi:GerAB/ArcD/ProY family transporter [Paenibacillus hemerocallicola]|uniref:GerAB/ArcD/ProY family transporter n=1 Tax=Paenibacillus hemerocallicola TaxID=1172614 RepID=UPI0024823B33|nr:endospore germination permease [Paenibacillus hemerocallicola]
MRQYVILTALFVIGDTILYIPAKVIGVGKESAWLSGFLAMVAGLCAAALYGVLASRFPRMTLIDIGSRTLGTWLGKSVGVLFVAFFLIDSAIVLWQVGDFMATHIMPETPIQAFLILFMLVVLMGFRLGIGTVVRSAELLFFWVVVLFAMLVVMLTPQIDPKHLKPFFDKGPNPVLRGTLQLAGYYFEAVTLMMVLPTLRKYHGITGAYLLGIAAGSFILSVTVMLCILVLGTDLTELQLFSTYVLAKKISIANFLERIEVVMASIWFFTLFFKLYVCFYATVEGAAQLLKLKDGKALSLPVAALLIPASLLLVPNVVYFNDNILNMWWGFSATFGLLLPSIFFGASLLKKKRIEPRRVRGKRSG